MATTVRASLLMGSSLGSPSSSQVSVFPRHRVVALRPRSKVVRKAAAGTISFSTRRLVVASATDGREKLDTTPHGSEQVAYCPPAAFYKVEAIVRPWRLSTVASALLESGIRGVTVSDVRGFGSQGGSLERHAGSEFSEDSFVTKVKLEVVVSNDQVEVVIDTIIEHARTGEIGDGKIFIIPVADVIRVRTGERGLKAERMAGGRADLLSMKT